MSRKRILILGNMAKPGIAEKIDEILPWLNERADVLAVCRADQPDIDQAKKADLCVVFGGDGTLLSATRALACTHVPLLGVNMGKLGFLAEYTVENLQRYLPDVLSGRVKPIERMMLKACVNNCRHHQFCATAVNDVTIHAGAPHRMIDLSVTHNGTQVSAYLGDGLIVSSPTGSTAYSLSLGGPILHPSLDAIIITPVAPHTLSLRPIVLGSCCAISITASRVNPGTAIVIDGQVTAGLCDGDTVQVTRADCPARIVPCPDRTFFDTLTDKLHWSRRPHYHNPDGPTK